MKHALRRIILFHTRRYYRSQQRDQRINQDQAVCVDPLPLRGLVSNGALCVQDYSEDYVQTGPGRLYALSTRMFSVDRESVPYSWNHTITYDPARGKMPYLVEALHASGITALYHPLEEVLEYRIHAAIAKGTGGTPLIQS